MRALLRVILGFSVSAQPSRDLVLAQVGGARRVALVIGNDAYAAPANPLHKY